jgi:hypothetical protein
MKGWLANRSSQGRLRQARLRCFAATSGNLRLTGERRMVDQNSASWNQIEAWLNNLSGLRTVA